jgi:phosphoglycolate phosphatase
LTSQPTGSTPVEAVIFDRDGTILDFYDMFHRFIADLHDAAGQAPPAREEILGYAYWQSIIDGTLRIGEAVVNDRITDVPLRYIRHGSLYPGTAQAIRELAARGVRVGIVSSWVGTEATVAFLRAESLLRHVAVVVTHDDCGEDAGHAHRRSAAIKRRVLEIAIARLGVRASRVVVVGDSPDDVEAGSALGARTAAVLTGNGTTLRPAIEALGPRWILPGAADVVAVVDRERAA